MDFVKHGELEGKHAFLSASKYHWLNYDAEKLTQVYLNQLAVQNGTELHDLACRLIKKRVKLPASSKTLNMYVNDAINYRMTPEQVLFYSNNCFGTADSIGFRKGMLRIHDLKTGLIPGHMEQLKVYTALFCLEYNQKPDQIKTELRIYQNDSALIEEPNPDEIKNIMEKIVAFDKQLNKLKVEEGVLL